MINKVIISIDQAKDLDLNNVPIRMEPQRILMCPPNYFEIKEEINPFMKGQIGRTDFQKAKSQWAELKSTFENLGKQVIIIDPIADLEDMVFTANQVLPGVDIHGNHYVVLSRMFSKSRRSEVSFFRQWFEERNYQIIELEGDDIFFEGQGDAIWHPGKQLLWGGYGHRSTIEAYRELSSKLKIPVIALETLSPFYHLDTCFCILDNNTVLIHSKAFTEEGLNLINHFFSNLIDTVDSDANEKFVCNALSLDNKYIVIQRGSKDTVSQLEKRGFEVVEVETGEFIKSGGSVFCLKMMVY